MISLYDAPEPLVRVLAYTNTMQLPRNAALEKEMRERLPRVASKIEQYMILYALASLTRSEADFDALMGHVFRYGYVVGYASYIEDNIRVSRFLFAELYPWMVHNNVYKRDAWLCGIICADHITGTLTTEARSDYHAEFPKGTDEFPESSSGDNTENYRQGGLSWSEILWFEGESWEWSEKEREWVDSCVNMPYREKSLYNEAWFRTFDAFLPVVDLGEKDAEWVRLAAWPPPSNSITPAKNIAA